MNTPITVDFFRTLADRSACETRVRTHLPRADSDDFLVNFFVAYASWNASFANGVSALTSLIGRSRLLFTEPGFPSAVADRSNLVASYFFDAARDEYDDHINPARDTHRCLAEAFLLGLRDLSKANPNILDQHDTMLLTTINLAVLDGYTGAAVSHQSMLARCFFGMGFHLGSELLADQEFSILDSALRATRPELVNALMHETQVVAGVRHRCYAWIGIHSGQGGGVEADHFALGLEGVNVGLSYIPEADRVSALEALAAGFQAFDAHHAHFFNQVLPIQE